MDALTPPAPLKADEPPAPVGPACTLCAAPAVVHWLRRPTDTELDEVIAVEQGRRDSLLLLADPQQPVPEFPPLPTSENMTRTVYACAEHAITLDGAARIHDSTCTAPNEADLPGCDCTPEHPPQDPEPEPETSRLPEHWTTGGT